MPPPPRFPSLPRTTVCRPGGGRLRHRHQEFVAVLTQVAAPTHAAGCRRSRPLGCEAARSTLVGVEPLVAIVNGLGATSSSPSMPNRPYASVPSGPCWVHTISGTAGLRRARAVTLGMRESQVTRHAPFRPARRSSLGTGSKSHPATVSPPGSCPRGGGHRGRASPAGRAGNHRRQVQATSFSRACHPRAYQQR